MLGGSVDSDITYMPALIFIALLDLVALSSNITERKSSFLDRHFLIGDIQADNKGVDIFFTGSIVCQFFITGLDVGVMSFDKVC